MTKKYDEKTLKARYCGIFIEDWASGSSINDRVLC